MQVFISSVISGFEPFREAAASAIRALGHDVTRAEDFAASSSSPQVTCLEGVRNADLVVLLLGERYGAPQPSGLSATHEEFREAKRSKPVLAFVRDGVQPEASQSDFIDEVQKWETGTYTRRFATAEEFRDAVTRAIHEWSVSNAAGRIDPDEIKARALALLPAEDRHHGRGELRVAISVAGGPRQALIQPSELESEKFKNGLIQEALFGPYKLFSPSLGTQAEITEHALLLKQDSNSITVDEEGSIAIELVLPEQERGLPVLVEEDVQAAIDRTLLFASTFLQQVDSTNRLSHVVPAAGIYGAEYSTWATREERQRMGSSVSISLFGSQETNQVTLKPPYRSRAALRLEHEAIARDLCVLLRRRMRQR